jgi:hypothetical protein
MAEPVITKQKLLFHIPEIKRAIMDVISAIDSAAFQYLDDDDIADAIIERLVKDHD